MKSRAWDLGQKLLIGYVLLAVADKMLNPYKPGEVKTPASPLRVIWTNPKL